MRWVYYGMLLEGFVGHFALVNAIEASCVSSYARYVPVPLITLTLLVFRTLVIRKPERPLINADTCDAFKSGFTMCKICCRLKDYRTFHCKLCGQCVVNFDHHCDVLDICIGKGNINHFRFFLSYHVLLCAYALYEHRMLIQCHSNPIPTIAIATVVIEFSLGTACACFALFHVLLCVSCTRTYDIIRWCHRPRAKKRIALIKCD